jgi:predicted PurR-regulated permease PerM
MTGKTNDRDFIRRALIVIALGAAALLVWQLRYVLVLLFGAIVTATVIRAIADPFTDRLRVPAPASMLIAVLLIVFVVGGVAWLLGSQIAIQTQSLADTLPAALKRVDDGLAGLGLAHPIQSWLAQLHSNGGSLVSRVGSWASSASNGIAILLIVFFGGVFLAAKPRFYRTGAIKLDPSDSRTIVAEAMDES